MNSQVGRVGKRHRLAFGIVAGMIAVAPYAAIVLASGTTADRVLGQLGFMTSAVNMMNAEGLNLPGAVAIDTSATPNRVYVADDQNSRVLGWRDTASFTNGAPADLVIGQPDFTSSSLCNGGSDQVTSSSMCYPYGVAVDGSGNLYVADTGNSRVLEYTNQFRACAGVFPCVGGPAHLVFGQLENFTTNHCNNDTGGGNSTANDMCYPWGVAVGPSGNLYVADSGNSRMLEYNTPLTNTTPNTVLGQRSFTTNGCNSDTGGGNSTANDLCVPWGGAVDGSGDLYVADTANNRVLEYNTPLSTGAGAALVFGQGSFTTYFPNNGGVSANSLNSPYGIAFDLAGNLYVADSSNNRVLEYTAPLTPNTTADAVFGQGSFTTDISNSGGVSASSLNYPLGVAFDAAGNLYVADTNNSRVLEHNTPLPADTTADRVLGQLGFATSAVNMMNAAGLNLPGAVAIDTSATQNRVYVADAENSRVLGWRDAGSFTNGAPADLVIGQPDFTSSSLCDGASGTVSSNTLCYPLGVAVDGTGNLYVADSSNNRVLEYTNPFAVCNNNFPCVGGPANLVLGQGESFTTNGCNNDTGGGNSAASDLCSPWGVAVDVAGNLYVADKQNNRVLEYNAPLSTGTAAAMVFGQGGIFTTDIPNNGGVSANSLSYPEGVALDVAGNLYVADSDNNRVLEYTAPLTPNTTADTVVGQGGFTSYTCNNGGGNANSLCYPDGVAVDGTGNLYVGDTNNDRVLEYNTPLSTGATADRVFGQGGSFKTGGPNNGGVSANSLYYPGGVAVDVAGNLYVADTYNSRVLKYDQPLAAPTPTISATPAATPTATAMATSTPTATPTPTATATSTPTATPTPTPVPASLTVSSKTLHFPTSQVGSTSKPGKVKLFNPRTNKQDLPILIAAAVATPPFNIDEALSTCQVGMELAPKRDCFFFLTYTASALGKQNGTFTITDNSKTAAQAIVKLDGAGKAPKK